MLWSVMCSEDLGSFFIDLWDHLGGSLKTLFSFRLTRMFDYYFFDLKYFFIVIEMRLGVFNFEDRWRSFIFACSFVWQTWIWDWFTRFWLGRVRLVKVRYELKNLWIGVMPLGTAADGGDDSNHRSVLLYTLPCPKLNIILDGLSWKPASLP